MQKMCTCILAKRSFKIHAEDVCMLAASEDPSRSMQKMCVCKLQVKILQDPCRRCVHASCKIPQDPCRRCVHASCRILQDLCRRITTEVEVEVEELLHACRRCVQLYAARSFKIHAEDFCTHATRSFKTWAEDLCMYAARSLKDQKICAFMLQDP